jgi:site-specific recombinase XerD
LFVKYKQGFMSFFEQWLPDFKQKLIEHDLAPATVQGYLSDIGYFLRWLYELTGADEVTSLDIRAYRQYLVQTKRLKAATVNRRLQAIRRLFAWAVQTKRLDKSPAQSVRFMRKAKSKQPAALLASEVHALLRAAEQSSHGLAKRNVAIVQLMLQAGLRIGEVVALCYQDIVLNERSGRVRIVQGKRLKEREVPLNATARRTLLAYLGNREPLAADEPLFVSKQGKKPTIRALQKMMATLAKQAKLTRIPVTAHTLRHTFATHYLKANPGHLVELAMLMGHDSVNTTAIYTKASKEALAEDIERSDINIYD